MSRSARCCAPPTKSRACYLSLPSCFVRPSTDAGVFQVEPKKATLNFLETPSRCCTDAEAHDLRDRGRLFVGRSRGVPVLLRSFTASVVSGYDVLVNEDKTRSFVCLRVRGGRQMVLNLIAKVDPLMRRFKQPVYYEVNPACSGWVTAATVPFRLFPQSIRPNSARLRKVRGDCYHSTWFGERPRLYWVR